MCGIAICRSRLMRVALMVSVLKASVQAGSREIKYACNHAAICSQTLDGVHKYLCGSDSALYATLLIILAENTTVVHLADRERSPTCFTSHVL